LVAVARMHDGPVKHDACEESTHGTQAARLHIAVYADNRHRRGSVPSEPSFDRPLIDDVYEQDLVQGQHY
jgi:hypothetical protein